VIFHTTFEYTSLRLLNNVLLIFCVLLDSQISLLDAIDNLWVLAVERADMAGKELAKVFPISDYVTFS